MRDSGALDPDLIARAQGGDRSALEALFEHHWPELLQVVRFRLGPGLRGHLESQDIVQSAYLDAFEDLSRFEYRGTGAFLAWLVRIVENKIRRRVEYHAAQRRDKRREVGFSDAANPPGLQPTPSRQLIDGEERERLERAMDRLSDSHREVLIHRYYLEVPWRDIGELMGRSEEACQMLGRRALLELRRIYEDLGRPGLP